MMSCAHNGIALTRIRMNMDLISGLAAYCIDELLPDKGTKWSTWITETLDGCYFEQASLRPDSMRLKEALQKIFTFTSGTSNGDESVNGDVAKGLTSTIAAGLLPLPLHAQQVRVTPAAGQRLPYWWELNVRLAWNGTPARMPIAGTKKSRGELFSQIGILLGGQSSKLG